MNELYNSRREGGELRGAAHGEARARGGEAREVATDPLRPVDRGECVQGAWEKIGMILGKYTNSSKENLFPGRFT